jgi:hypothetical protein
MADQAIEIARLVAPLVTALGGMGRMASMKYFPTKILLATEASKDARKASHLTSDSGLQRY